MGKAAHTAVWTVIWALSAGLAAAEPCPAFYRFVDFGLEDRTGTVHRGGHIFRVEGFDGAPTLIRSKTTCRAVHEVSYDGHAHPIPVVTHFAYNPEKTLPALRHLDVTASQDAVPMAEANASLHRTRLAQPGMTTTKGEDFLCAGAADMLSCQVQSPYPTAAPLVVYCAGQTCEMPVLAFNEKIILGASWDQDADAFSDPQQAGTEISEMIRRIHDFLHEQF